MSIRKSLGVIVVAGAAILGSMTLAAADETKTVRFAQQFGIGYLPLSVMRDMKLVEKHAKEAGLGDITVEWTKLTGGAPINDALISGQIDFASGGVGPLVTIWAKTKGNLNVKGVASLNAMPLYLNTTDPNVKTIKDFTDKDRIALPSVKVSIQAVTLQMAAAKAFGEDKYNALDKLTVSMSHPDGMAALLSGRSEITGHFTSAPFMYLELDNSKVHKVLSSYEVLGGPGTFNLLWAKQEFVDNNPKTFKAVYDALEEAMDFINKNPDKAAASWIKVENSKLAPALVEKIIRDPENKWTVAPQNIMAYADFMNKVGSIKVKPDNWKEMFFPPVHDKEGS
ncbi:MAG: ABC transporter substrate-binding protein [Rhodomicrobiaceae bacterium]